MCSSYSTQLNFEHTCLPQEQHHASNGKNITERDIQIFRDARNEFIWSDEEGRLLQCNKCNFKISPVDVINTTFSERMREYGIDTDDTLSSKPTFSSKLKSMTDAQLDAAAYSYSYDFMDEETEVENIYADSIFGDKDMRDLMLQFRMEQHATCHNPSCFKKGCECRFLFPFKYCESTEIYTKEDGTSDLVPWHRLSDPNVIWLSPWLLTTQRELGSEYLNTHNEALSHVFNCNTNVQVGDIWQIYYSTLYGSKSTQKEDTERVQRILQCVVKRLLRLEEIALTNSESRPARDECFSKSLGVMLSGLQAATSRHTVSATLAHLIVSLGGTRFKFSHDFGTLLVSQLDATLENKPVDVYVKRTTIKKKTIMWHDSSSEDYIFRPTELEKLCAYEMAMHFMKVLKPMKILTKAFGEQTNHDADDTENANDSIYMPMNESDFPTTKDDATNTELLEFNELHPNRKFTYLRRRKCWVVPITYYDGNALCSQAKLHINDGAGTTNSFTDEYREDYARIALLMFYPLRSIEDIKLNGSHWQLFHRELMLHRNGNPTTMWSKGFEILQNIENRKMLESGVKKIDDEITEKTTNRCNMPGSRSKGKPKKQKEEEDDQ